MSTEYTTAIMACGVTYDDTSRKAAIWTRLHLNQCKKCARRPYIKKTFNVPNKNGTISKDDKKYVGYPLNVAQNMYEKDKNVLVIKEDAPLLPSEHVD